MNFSEAETAYKQLIISKVPKYRVSTSDTSHKRQYNQNGTDYNDSDLSKKQSRSSRLEIDEVVSEMRARGYAFISDTAKVQYIISLEPVRLLY